MSRDLARALDFARVGAALRHGDAVRWRYHLRLEKRWGDWALDDIRSGKAPAPHEVIEREHNLLMTAGATALWNGLVTAGLATPFTSTNAQLAVGDSNTAASAGQTDLQAAAGATANSGDPTAATNASPIVITVPSWTVQPSVGQVVVVAGINGNTAANGTFEVSAVTATTLTLLNSSGNGAFSTSAGATIKPINKYRQLVNGAPSVSTNQVQFVSVFATANANFHWQEFGTTTGGGATNKQAAPPPTLLNRAVSDLGTKTSAASWTATETITLS